MSKKLVQSTQCRRCLKPLTWIQVESSICKCGKKEKEHFTDKLYCYEVDDRCSKCETFTPVIAKKLLDKDLCKSCLDKDEKKAKKIKRAQRKIGIKATRKKKVTWKSKPEQLKSNEPLPVFYLKRSKKAIYTKYSLKGKWKKTSPQKLAHLERNYLCRGNPDEILSVT